MQLIPKRGLFDPSCPRLSRASTSYFVSVTKDVDGRDKPGHDAESVSITATVGIARLTTLRPGCPAGVRSRCLAWPAGCGRARSQARRLALLPSGHAAARLPDRR